MLPSLLFPWPRSAPPHFLHSRIATGKGADMSELQAQHYMTPEQ